MILTPLVSLALHKVSTFDFYEVVRAERTMVYAGKLTQRVQDRLTLRAGDSTFTITVAEWTNAAKRNVPSFSVGSRLVIEGGVKDGELISRDRVILE